MRSPAAARVPSPATLGVPMGLGPPKERSQRGAGAGSNTARCERQMPLGKTRSQVKQIAGSLLGSYSGDGAFKAANSLGSPL